MEIPRAHRLHNGASRLTAVNPFRANLTQDKLSPCQAWRLALFSATLLMQKTKKSVAKRFKLTATGKLMRRTPGFRHLLSAKSTKQKRRASKDKLVAPGHAKPLKRCLPFGL
jgi:large subunit ribosomal protein L35